MISFFLVFIGGGLGSLCRYAIAQLMIKQAFVFPMATFMANALSCIILGLLLGFTLKNGLSSNFKLLLMTGFCGGFSTFSTFSLETFLLFESGEIFFAFANIFLSLALCLLCVYLGIKMVV